MHWVSRSVCKCRGQIVMRESVGLDKGGEFVRIVISQVG
jgi:hypothetical protein